MTPVSAGTHPMYPGLCASQTEISWMKSIPGSLSHATYNGFPLKWSAALVWVGNAFRNPHQPICLALMLFFPRPLKSILSINYGSSSRKSKVLNGFNLSVRKVLDSVQPVNDYVNLLRAVQKTLGCLKEKIHPERPAVFLIKMWSSVPSKIYLIRKSGVNFF